MKGIRLITALLILFFVTTKLFGGEQIVLQKVQGDVTVRAGVTETWSKLSAGHSLNPDATVKTGAQSSAVILLPSSNKKISLPPEVIVDISDIRELTQEELMLKLTMEKVRASSYQWKGRELNLPNETAMHGDPKDQKQALSETDPKVGVMEMNGIKRVLFDNGFYSTSALKALDVLRRYPALKKFENRLLIAESLEKSNLKSEALNEYVSLSMSTDITPEQKELVQAEIAKLKT
ncbi:MAG: hypothetical protein HY961_03850 [Ignavibacteriae bacterium]|nr:hypothetical protein [Ignavibacteriota bacterium]